MGPLGAAGALGTGRRAWGGLLLVAALVLAAGCAVEAPPPGGKPDATPPRLADSAPPYGAVGIPRTQNITFVFSEPMERRETERAVFVAPEPRWARFDWDRATFTLSPAESLLPDRVYVAVVGRKARDRHGNGLGQAAWFGFTTGGELPTATLAAKVTPLAGGESARLFALRALPGEEAPVFDPRIALSAAETDSTGAGVLPCLAPDSTTWIFAFVDRNRTGGFDPQEGDPWGWHPAPLRPALADSGAPAAVRLADPRREGIACGRVRDFGGIPHLLVIALSLGDTAAATTATGASADSGHTFAEAPQGQGGEFLLPLPPGRYHLGTFCDRNDNRSWDRPQPAEAPADSEMAPPADTTEVVEWAEEAVTIRLGERAPAVALKAPPVPAAPPDSSRTGE